MNRIEEIMKPYFDKEEEIKKLESDRKSGSERKVEINILKRRIENLRENKETEINEYLWDYADPASLSHIRAIRTTLEDAYSEKEEKLQKELEALEASENSVDYSRVYKREMEELKDELRIKLTKEKRELELKLKEAQIDFDIAILKLNKFELQYDESHRALNGDHWRGLFGESNKTSEIVMNIKKDIKKIDDYLELVKSTRDLYTLSPLEQAMYDKRNKSDLEEQYSQFTDTNGDEEIHDKRNKSDLEEQYSQFTDTDGNEEIHDNIELSHIIYDEVMATVDRLDTIKVLNSIGSEFDNNPQRILQHTIFPNDGLENYYEHMGELNLELPGVNLNLPNGEYLNFNDFYTALENYCKKNKGKKYELADVGTVQIDRKNLRKLKKALKRLSSIELTESSKQRSYFGAKKIRINENKNRVDAPLSIGLRDVRANDMPDGLYVNKQELIDALNHLFTTKSVSWVQRFRDAMSELKIEESDAKVKSKGK